MTLARTAEPPEAFVLGDAPFWPVDWRAEPGAWVGHIPFAFWIVEALRPRVLVELGTHSGNSYLAFAQAVHRLGLGTACFAVDTWQGDAHAGYYGEEVFHELSRYHDGRYGAFSRLVRSTFDEAVQHFPDASVDLLHVDGYHTYEAVAHDVETWRPKLSSRAVVLLHDINVRERDFGVWRLWSELSRNHPHFEFLHAHGLGVLGLGAEVPDAVTALLQSTRDAARASRIRDAFARLGSAVVEQMQFQARVGALQNEIDRLGEALRVANQELAARDERPRLSADERAAFEEAARSREQVWGDQVERLGEALRVANQELAVRDEQLRLSADERAALEEAARAREQVWGDQVERLGEALRTAAQEIAARDERLRLSADERAAFEEAARSREHAQAREIEKQRGLIHGLQHEIVRLGTLRETDLAAFQTQHQRAERERAEASGEAETLRAALSSLHQSRSLRLTRPLRQLGGWYRIARARARGAPSP